jgi:hypothetical protein
MNRAILVLGFLAAGSLAARSAHAQLGSPFDLCWNTIDGGGSASTGAAFVLTGTIGQPDAGPVLTGGAFALTGGFWPGALPAACPADFNRDGMVNSQDYFDFLVAFFASDPTADFNNDGMINSQDYFDFLTAFFAGCP